MEARKMEMTLMKLSRYGEQVRRLPSQRTTARRRVAAATAVGEVAETSLGLDGAFPFCPDMYKVCGTVVDNLMSELLLIVH